MVQCHSSTFLQCGVEFQAFACKREWAYLTCLAVRRPVSEEEFKSPTFGVGLEVSVREIGGKTLVPLLNELLLTASESSSTTDLESASAFETASKLTANGIATLGTLDLNKFSGGLKNVSESTVEETGLNFAGFSEGGLQPYFRSKSRDFNHAWCWWQAKYKLKHDLNPGTLPLIDFFPFWSRNL